MQRVDSVEEEMEVEAAAKLDDEAKAQVKAEQTAETKAEGFGTEEAEAEPFLKCVECLGCCLALGRYLVWVPLCHVGMCVCACVCVHAAAGLFRVHETGAAKALAAGLS